jgi:hypothetical protein
MDSLDRRTAALVSAHHAHLRLHAEVDAALAEHHVTKFQELPRPLRRRFGRALRALTPVAELRAEANDLERLLTADVARMLAPAADPGGRVGEA